MRRAILAAAIAAGGLVIPTTALAADVRIQNADPAGAGLNDPRPATPVGGNLGTTVGEQRRIVLDRAAAIWGHRLVSTQPIVVRATFTPLLCSATSAVLGSAGAASFFRDVPPAVGGRAMEPGTWYPVALAEKVTRRDLDPFEVRMRFNSELGNANCLPPGFYLGLDGEEPAGAIDLLAVALHEIGHGLGFSVGTTSGSTGARTQGHPSVWEQHMLDASSGKRWVEMTDAERAASARSDGRLVWAGRHASNVVPSTLAPGLRLEVRESDPRIDVEVVRAGFGGDVERRASATLVAPADTGGPSPRDACEGFAAGAVPVGAFVLVDRGSCTFVVKARNAQAAGASGVVVANNVAGAFGLGGTAPDVVIPVLGVRQGDGAALRAAAPASIILGVDPLQRSGTTAGLPRLFAPPGFQAGSSVSHWDVSASPDLVMEPFISGGLGHSVKHPDDLTAELLKDIGW